MGNTAANETVSNSILAPFKSGHSAVGDCVQTQAPRQKVSSGWSLLHVPPVYLAIDLVSSEAGYRQVKDVLLRIEYGVNYYRHTRSVQHFAM